MIKDLTRDRSRDRVKAGLWLCGIAATAWSIYAIAHVRDLKQQEKYDAICNAIAEAHGWNPKHLSFDQECTVESAADAAMSNGADQ
jgi:hypothetical protein